LDIPCLRAPNSEGLNGAGVNGVGSFFARKTNRHHISLTPYSLTSQGRYRPIARQREPGQRPLGESNKELTRSQAAVQARYELAVEAIKTFYTGMSEDVFLKEEQFKGVRDRLLKSASDFYGKLGALLGKESDLTSRRALWEANAEVADLTGKIGKPEDALAAHRQVLVAREVLAVETPADPDIDADMGRSLRAIAFWLQIMGKTKESE
jgi:eukaryotic-like serine/threonine-protein kinase